MKAKTQYAIIVSLIIFLAVILKNSTFPLKITLCLTLAFTANHYYNKKVQFKKNGEMILFLLIISLIVPNILLTYFKMDNLTISPFIDACIYSTICFVFFNYFIYE
ncbi:hypothetical protein [Helcococcus kunzii]|uniref:hypothetical protein n=1 Tax=Helcococcus kunzii TaxID=40091 RepID=UPI0024AE6069|nr:hypothetical protein [Helcococcus kunzii]